MRTGCFVCGKPLVYLDSAATLRCALCGAEGPADARCADGHFVCDACHRAGALEVIERVCLSTDETDMLVLLSRIRAHPAFSLHGPEHHALVPAVMLATWRNLGGEVSDEDLRLAIRRGQVIPGGFCGRAGVCGAAVGVGIGLGILTGSTPLDPERRQALFGAVSQVIAAQASRRAARCCQRECAIALVEAARLSRDLLPVPLRAEGPLRCAQHARNRECIGEACPVWPPDGEPGEGGGAQGAGARK